jgi:hypothetical protein
MNWDIFNEIKKSIENDCGLCGICSRCINFQQMMDSYNLGWMIDSVNRGSAT